MSESEAKQMLMNLVDKYEKSHEKIDSSINSLRGDVVEVKNDVKFLSYRIDEHQKVIDRYAKDEKVIEKIKNMLSNASKIYIPLIIMIVGASIFGIWEFIKKQMRIN